MRKPTRVFVWLLVVAITGGTLWGFYAASRAFFTTIAQLRPEIAAAIVGSLGTILAGVGGVVINQRSLRKREIAEAHRPQKTEAYKGFIDDIIIDTLRGVKDNPDQPMDEGKLQDLFYRFTADILVWGSPAFIKAFLNFKEAGRQESEEVLLYLDDMIQAIRDDLGHNDFTLQRGELIKLLLTNPEEIEKLRRD